MQYELPAFNDALTGDDEARKTFTWMGEAHQCEFLGWIKSAISEVESRQRIQAAVDMLAGRDVIRRN
jgi:Bacteriocin-protection, YdeI or OmpD-Associated